MTELHIERTGGFAGACDMIHIDDLDAEAPQVRVEAFMSTPQDHALARDLRDQLRTALADLGADAAGAGDPPRGADRYQWSIRSGATGSSLVFHDPISNPAAQAIAVVATQLFATS
jgi:hypothetical protein